MNGQELLQKLQWRYATKQFDTTKKISDETLNVLLESMRLSPSSFGLQWRWFVVVTDQETRQKLLPYTRGQSQVVDASHLLVLCRRTDVDSDFVHRYLQNLATARGVEIDKLDGHKNMLLWFLEGKNDLQLNEWLSKQAYIPLGFLLSACAMLGVDSCPMEGFDPAKYNEILGLAEHNLASCTVVPIGYRSSDDKYASMTKARFATEDLIVYK